MTNTKKRPGRKKAPVRKPPANTGTLIDKVIDLRAKRLALEKSVDKLKSEEASIKDKIVSGLLKQGLERATGKKGTLSYKTVAVGHVNDWDAFYKYVKRTNSFELLERRIAQSVLREVVTDKRRKNPDGVQIGSVVKVNLTTRRDA